jgi:hypothetical protein
VLAYQGPLPPSNAIPITVPYFAGMAFMHIVIQSEAQHARLISRVVTREGSGVPAPVGQLAPKAFFLAAAAPNPFHETTVLTYGGPHDADAVLAVFDVTGRRLRTLVDGPVAAGLHRIAWNGCDDRGQPLDSGIYYVRLTVDDHREAQRIIVLR